MKIIWKEEKRIGDKEKKNKECLIRPIQMDILVDVFFDRQFETKTQIMHNFRRLNRFLRDYRIDIKTSYCMFNN